MKAAVGEYRIAIITSVFNQPLTEALREGADRRLLELGCQSDHIDHFSVPGAVEIPLIAKKLALKKHYHALITLGAVIRGETTHYDYVCQQVSYGVQKVALENQIPVIFGVLTTENGDQAWDRVGGAHGHKGIDAANAALEMIQLINTIG